MTTLKDTIDAQLSNHIKTQNILYENLVVPALQSNDMEQINKAYQDYQKALGGFDNQAYKKTIQILTTTVKEQDPKRFSQMIDLYDSVPNYITYRNNWDKQIKLILEMDGSNQDKQNMINSLDYNRTKEHNKVIQLYNELNKLAKEHHIAPPYPTDHEFDKTNSQDREQVAEILSKHETLFENSHLFLEDEAKKNQIESETDKFKKMSLTELKDYALSHQQKKKEPQSTSTFVQAKTNEKGIIEFNNEQSFSNPYIAGVQKKGMAIINNQEKFIKLDELSSSIPGHWENNFNAMYASISESITSCFVQNLQPDPNFDCAIYDFAIFQLDDTIKSGTVADNYLKENEVEHILSTGHTNNHYVAMEIQDYTKKVIDVPTSLRFKNLTHELEKLGVPTDKAEHFLVQQATFDILTGNIDRLHNPSNFVVAYNVKTKTGRPINMDFGRTLTLPAWTTTMEEKYDCAKYLSEDLNNFKENIQQRNDSLLSTLNQTETTKFLKDHDFKPFQLDKKGLYESLDQLQEKISQSELPLTKFAQAKIMSFKAVLDDPTSQLYYEDTSKEQTTIYENEKKDENIYEINL